jgi:hypothetical protein
MCLRKIVTMLIIKNKWKWKRRLHYIIHDVYCDVTYPEYLHAAIDITKNLTFLKCFKIIFFSICLLNLKTCNRTTASRRLILENLTVNRLDHYIRYFHMAKKTGIERSKNNPIELEQKVFCVSYLTFQSIHTFN